MQSGKRNTFKILLAGALAQAAYPKALFAAAYPERPVRVIAPYAPGGTTDFITRLIAQNLQDELGQSFVVENKPGAGGNIGSNFVVNARPDGYTLLAGSLSTFALNAAVYRNLGHDPLVDLVPVAMTTVVPLVLVASPQLKVADLKGLVALLKANPGKYNYGSSGSGTSSHIAFELFLDQTATEVVHVPYKGVSQALVDLLAGNISLLFASPSVVLEYLNSGRLIALAAVSPDRLKALPDVPTAAEAGFPEFDAYSWNCLFAPKNTPSGAVQVLFDAVQRILKKPAVLKQFEEQGMLPMASRSHETTVQYTRDEFNRWVPFVKKMNIRLD